MSLSDLQTAVDVSGALSYVTPGGVSVRRRTLPVEPTLIIDELARSLDGRRGVLLTSDFEYPNRYSRWSRGFSAPPLAIVAHGYELTVEALNDRGLVLLRAAIDMLGACPDLRMIGGSERTARFTVRRGDSAFTEEYRIRQPSVFSAVRALISGFAGADQVLGLYGAFGYDLVFQFDTLTARHEREQGQADMVLYLPDDVVVVDNQRGTGHRYQYEFTYGGESTADRSMEPYPEAVDAASPAPEPVDFAFAEGVERAKEAFRRGDLFEVVLTKTFRRTCVDRPSAVFGRLRSRNPAPYGALLNLGAGEFLVSGSPEMFVRVSGSRVETCPISGTISRGSDALNDSELIRTLLNSSKDESELTMCTDVDRNDKARVCVPGSVRVIGRRQIEAYSRVIHTVDHIEGTLREEFDGIDAFLTHMWAVTVTGAPKLWAMRFIEEHEADPRRWYGGAIGYLGFDGNVNTGLTLRTVRIKNGQAEIRAGGTLLHDSVPLDEEEEVRIKAAAFLDALDGETERTVDLASTDPAPLPPGSRVLILDCEDSFVHTLGDYVRQAGADVRIVRAPLPLDELAGHLDDFQPGVLLLSPGPGRPSDFRLNEVISLALSRDIAIFGVCLGLQAIGEYFGGRLDLLAEPMHGKASTVFSRPGRFFMAVPEEFKAGRYHSLFLRRHELPAVLTATGWTRDDVVMQLEHATLPIAAVQFHPESIMTSGCDQGMKLLRYALARLLPTAAGPPAR